MTGRRFMVWHQPTQLAEIMKLKNNSFQGIAASSWLKHIRKLKQFFNGMFQCYTGIKAVAEVKVIICI